MGLGLDRIRVKVFSVSLDRVGLKKRTYHTKWTTP